MSPKELIEELEYSGFVLVGMPEHCGGKTMFALYNEDNLEIARAEIDVARKQISLSSSFRENLITFENLEILSLIDSFVEDVTDRAGEVEISQEDLEAAKLIREVKTLRLNPDDKIVVVVKMEGIDGQMLDNLRGAMLRWLGEKNSNRVMVLVGDIELTKVRSEDERGNQEESN